jgi:hypothetical protein
MSIGERISRAAQTAQFWIGLSVVGAVGVAGATVALDARYAHAEDLKEVKTTSHENELRGVEMKTMLLDVRDDVRTLLEGFRQKEYREHRISIPDPPPIDMGAPAMGPRVR